MDHFQRRISVADPKLVEFKQRAHSLGDEVAAHLEQMIVVGHFPAGSSLPSERQLASDLGVSRTTVRDALAQLEAKRLVVRHQGKHSTVALPSSDTLALAERLNSLRERVDHVVENENIVEPGLAALAATRATPADVLQLEAVYAKESEYLPPELSVTLDVEFHYTLARMTRNTFLQAISGMGAERTQEIRVRAHATPEARRACIGGHSKILHAVSHGDAEAAEQAMREHLNVVHGYMGAGSDDEEEI
jgi:GntR family transcriptional repressor for pyruvate dehydrogenase complex